MITPFAFLQQRPQESPAAAATRSSSRQRGTHGGGEKLYKKVIGARRASWCIVSSIEKKEESHGNEDHVAVIRDYRSKIESELSNICDGILKLLDSRLIPSASSGDSKVFYLKMNGHCEF